MSIPNSPLLPGSKLEQAAKSRSTFSIAAFIFSAHVAVFLVVLLNGCNKESAATTSEPATPAHPTDLAVQPAQPPGGAADLVPPPGADALPTNPPTVPGGAVVTFPSGATNPPTIVPPPDLGVGPAGGGTPPETRSPGEPAGTATSEYKVKSGDIAFNIAKANGISLKALKDANPNIDLSKLKVNQVLQLPAAGTAKEAAPKKGTKAAKSAGADAADAAGEATGGSSHTVKGGDTLGKIAKKHGVTVKALRAANNLSGDKINIGQKLKIPDKGAPEATAPATEAPADAPIADPAPVAPPAVPGR